MHQTPAELAVAISTVPVFASMASECAICGTKGRGKTVTRVPTAT
jgi:hypothetical protein